MFESPLRPRRIAIGAAVVIAVGISCLGIVRVQRFVDPAGGVSYKCSTGAACVKGDSAGKPDGVEGLSTNSNGVFGFTSSTTGSSGVAGESNGTSGTSYGVFGSSSNGPGVYGLEANYYGVEGVSTNSVGVYGTTSSTEGNDAVVGISQGKTGASNGVYGSSASDDGVYGTSTKRTGVYGSGPKYGVEGESPDGSGVYGETSSTDAAGVFGSSPDGFAVYGQGGAGGSAAVSGISITGTGTLGETDSGVAVRAALGDSSGMIFYGAGVGSAECQIDSGANLSCTGTITGGPGSQMRHRTSAGRHVLAFASESTSATLEDFGTARMVRGVANVQIEPTFASTIDRERSYYVFLTPLGDTRGLYVRRKTPSGFEVRETQGGQSTLGFDYRIVAHPADAAGGRLEQEPVLKRPPPVAHVRVPRS